MNSPLGQFSGSPYQVTPKKLGNTFPNVSVYFFQLVLFSAGQPKISLSFGPSYVEKGKNITLPVCHVTGFPPPKITWRKEPNNIVQARAVVSDGQLSILNAQKRDSGWYKCQASNHLGHDSAVTDLNVVQRPHFIVKPPAHLKVRTMQNITVQCKAAGDPKPTVLWRKINGKMPGRRSNAGTNGMLKIWNLKPEDSGTYTCTAASNFFSSVFVAMALTVGIPSMKNTLTLLNSFNYSFRNTLPHTWAPSFNFHVICMFYVMLS